MSAVANVDYDWAGFPAADFCHTEGLVKALLLLESSSNTSTLQMDRDKHPLLTHTRGE